MTTSIPRSRRRQLQFAGMILVATAVILRLMGRAWWCQGGGINPWSSAVESFHNSQHLLDPYTFTHVLHGFGFYLVLWIFLRQPASLDLRGGITLLLESLWEILENTAYVIERYREATLALGYYGDSVLNSVGDIVACMAGFWLAARLPSRATVLLALGVEVLLLLWIRDSLLLNIIMLIWPVEAIRAWQLGGG